MSGAAEDPVGDGVARIAVGVIVAKRQLKGPWASHAWLPTDILPAPVSLAPWTRLAAGADERAAGAPASAGIPDETRDELFYAGAFEIALHRGETSHYRDNLLSGRPSLWVAMRPVGEDEFEVTTVTADPYEGESLAEGIQQIVEAVPMPAAIEAELAAFVAAFHVERPFFKRKRDRPDREALARGRGPREGDAT